MTDPAPLTPRGARTTKVRGRMSASALAAIEELAPRYLLAPEDLTAAGLDTVFGRQSARLLDIGVGTGEATIAWAEANPERDVIAVELHRPGISRLLRAADDLHLTNLRIVDRDVTVLLAEYLSPGNVDQVRVLFPDPWPKAKHRKRRLVDPQFLDHLCTLLPTGGTLHVATDWADYAEQIREVLAAEPRLQPVADAHGPDGWRSHRPERPVTTYEGRGLEAGRVIVDLIARLGPPR